VVFGDGDIIRSLLALAQAKVIGIHDFDRLCAASSQSLGIAISWGLVVLGCRVYMLSFVGPCSRALILYPMTTSRCIVE
jgi:hypothetical protein